jgi:Protein of unknown function (DUF2905)
MTDLGKILVGFGAVMLLLGGTLLLAGSLTGKVPWLGRLPGDIHIERGGWNVYIPLGTSLLVSIVLTVIFAIFGRR